jgi:hypothetical protein
LEKPPAKKVSKGKTNSSPPKKRTKPNSTAGTPAGKKEAQTKPKANKAQTMKQPHPPRVGSDGHSLRVGPCRLGNEDDQLAQGTIIGLTPKMFGEDISGKKFSWPFKDGVLCRFTAPLKGKSADTLLGSVFSVSTLHVHLPTNLYLLTMC